MNVVIPDNLLNTIVHGDARDIAIGIPDGSVDMIFTDPVYNNIDDYEWLAETGKRILRDGGVCLCFCSTPLLPAICNAMQKHLNYAWILYWQRHGHLASGKAGITVITTCLWFEKGKSKTIKKMADWCSTSNLGPSHLTHKWGKPLDLLEKWIVAFTCSGAIVYDPFCGSGSLPAACIRTGRNFIASEIDGDTYANAVAGISAITPKTDSPWDI